LNESFTEREDRYSAALTRAEFRLVKEKFESVSPDIPPILLSSREENITVYALSLFRDLTRWSIWIMAEEGEEGWVVTEGMVNRFIPDSYIIVMT
jgi:hypothetical protein